MFRLYGQSELTLKINLFDVVYMKNLNIVVFDFKIEFYKIIYHLSLILLIRDLLQQ